MRFEHGPRFASDVLDARPFGEDWFLLSREGPFDLGGLDGALELHLSPGGGFAAVVERYGRRGRVFELETARTTIALDRGDYLHEYSVFPATFVDHGGRTLLVHGSDWNRLDVSDPATGECVTDRGPTAAAEDNDLPPHYLDYFHGGLHPSPDGKRVADDGWLWHPMGEVRVWSIDAWLANPWESEDGASLSRPTYREDWDMPLCWTDERRLLVWGTGGFNEGEESTGFWIFDPELGTRQLLADSGSSANRPWPPNSANFRPWMTFDGLFFVIDPTTGTSVWSLDGECVHYEAGFAPCRYHPGRKEFLSWGGAEAFSSRLVP